MFHGSYGEKKLFFSHISPETTITTTGMSQEVSKRLGSVGHNPNQKTHW